ncbi:MAG TPA: DMT family transporter [Gammaproteobacteria bacterium]
MQRSALLTWFGVVLIWSTTPLAIQWSAQGAGFLYSLMTRMLVASALFALIVAWRRHGELFTRGGMIASLVAGFGIYASMMLVYWAAQFIPSGLIAVLFGLSPLAAALWSQWLLPGDRITRLGIVGVIIGIAGLWIIFGSGESLSAAAIPGTIAALIGVTIQNGTMVVLKRYGVEQSALTMTAGGVIVAAILYLPSWWLIGAPIPAEIPLRAVLAIVYLGVAGSVLGFMLYFSLLKRISAVSLSLVTLITPVTALLLGQWLNAEDLPREVWFGVACIMTGLVLYQFGGWRAMRASYRTLR